MSGIKYHLVGGAVRDRLLGLPVKDKDWVVTGATPEQMRKRGFRPVGKDFPVFLHPVTHEEYALARTERKTAVGYHGFQFHSAPDVTLEQDLLRRDLTINALAEDEAGNVIDYYGGLQDLQTRTLRHVSPAFSEDPVRVLRVARFQARFASHGFSIAAETMQLMQQMVSNGEVSSLVPERVWQEMLKALGETSPQAFISTLRECGALAVLFPEIDRLFGVPQPAKHHPEIDCGIHTLLVLQRAAELTNDPATRFAALTHDLGKGLTPPDILPHHYGHEESGVALVTGLCERNRVPNHFRQLAEMTARYHTHVHKALELTPSSILKVLEMTDAFRKPERFRQMLTACMADSQGRTGFEDRPYPQADFFVRMLTACQQADIKSIVARGFTGEKIRAELHQARIHLIKAEKALSSPSVT